MGTNDPLGQLVEYWYKSMWCCIKVIYFFEKLLYKPIRKKNKMGDLRKKFLSFFCKGPPLSKKLTKIFFYPDITIHTPIESPSQVYSKNVVFKNIFIDPDPKKPINSVKIRIF